MNKRYYWLQHKYKKPSWTSIEMKSIGFFSSATDAEEAIKELKIQKGFNNYPDGFCIIELILDEIVWDTLHESISPLDLPDYRK